MPIPSDDPTLRKSLERALNSGLRSVRTPTGFTVAYAVVTLPIYLIGEYATPYEPLGRGVIGVALLYGLGYLFVQALRSDIEHTTSVDPAPRPTGATGQSLSDVFLGYAFVGLCAFLGGAYLGTWYLASNPGAVAIGRDHFYAGAVLLAAAVGLAILETYTDYYGVDVQEWLEDRFGGDDGTERGSCD